jgi:hypothetical protein
MRPDTDPQTPPGAQVRVAGYGALKSGASTNTYRRPDGITYQAGSRKLLETAVPTVERAACKARYSASKIDEEQICAGLEQGGQDSCQGDSGGPLVAFDRNGCPYQVGVVSWGVGCAGARDYGVYTSVSYHASWITSHAGNVKAVALADLKSSAPTADNVFTSEARLQLEQILAPAKGRVSVKVQGGTRLPLGKEVAFTVRSEVAGRLILIDINSLGEVVQILPNKYTPAHTLARVASGTEVTVPGQGYGFTAFKAVEPIGKSQLIALVVPDNFPAESLVAEKSQLARGLTPVNAPINYLMNLVQQVVAALGARRGDQQAKDWGLGITDYEIVK